MNLTNIQKLALASQVSSKDKKELSAGVAAGSKFPVSMTVRFEGELVKGVDSERAPTVAIPLLETMALFIARAGATREATEAALVECMTEALLDDGKGQGALAENLPAVEAMLARVRAAVIDKLPRAKVQGGVKFKGKVEVIHAEGVIFQPEAVATVEEGAPYPA